jgi:hypothetical protein
MGNCSTCGNNIGFLGKAIKCQICGKDGCNACMIWVILEEISTKYGVKRFPSRSFTVCSDACAYIEYSNFIQTFKPELSIKLINLSNSGIGVQENLDKDAKMFSILYMTKDAVEISNGKEMAPQVKPIYDRIKSNLVLQKKTILGEFENVI